MFRVSNDSGAPAPAFATTTRFSPTLGFARRAFKLIFICATAALLAFWLVSPSGRRTASWGNSSASNCESYGRGGTFCTYATAEVRAPVRSSDPAVECLSLGRGGLICPATAKK